MPLPVFRGVGAKAAGTTAAVSVPLPTGISAGDICILVATTVAGGTVNITNSGGGAWSAIPGTPVDVTGGEKLYAWWRRHQSTDTAPSVQAASDHVCACVAAWYNCREIGNPYNVYQTGTETTSDTTLVFATTISTNSNDNLILLISTTGADTNTAQHSAQANSSLTNVVERADYCTNSGTGGGFQIVEGAKVTAGSIGTWTATLATASPKAYITFNLLPIIPSNPVAMSSINTLSIIGGILKSANVFFDSLNNIYITGSKISGAYVTIDSYNSLSVIGGRLVQSYLTMDSYNSLSVIGSRLIQSYLTMDSYNSLSVIGGLIISSSMQINSVSFINILGQLIKYANIFINSQNTFTVKTSNIIYGNLICDSVSHLDIYPGAVLLGNLTINSLNNLEIQAGKLITGYFDISSLSDMIIHGYLTKSANVTMDGYGIIYIAPYTEVLIYPQKDINKIFFRRRILL